jgi:hypothetical protein
MNASDVLIVVNITLVVVLNSVYQYKLGYKNGKADSEKKSQWK